MHKVIVSGTNPAGIGRAGDGGDAIQATASQHAPDPFPAMRRYATLPP